MKTKRQLLKIVAKYGHCKGVKCEECPYSGRHQPCVNVELKRIGAIALLRRFPKKEERKFDLDKILTCVTADNAVIGTEGYFADDLDGLKRNFKNNSFYKLLSVHEECCVCRFKNEKSDYALFYPIEDIEWLTKF